MKKKLRKVLSEKCKDFGLTEKGLDDLVEIGLADLTDDSTDEEIASKADSLVPFAKAMQGEITRKTQKPKPSAKQSTENEEDDETGEGKGEGKKNNEVPDWFKGYQKKLDDLEKENEILKAEKAAKDRAVIIAEKAKKLKIPEFLLAGRTFKEDADIDKELEEFKQQLVNHNLMPKGQTHESATSKEQMTAEEEAWAKGLPDKK